MQIHPNNDAPGALVTDLDVAAALRGAGLQDLKEAVWRYGVVAVRDQHLTVEDFEQLAAVFGKAEVPASPRYSVPGHETVLIISNVLNEAGEPIGLTDAGLIWHTDSIWDTLPTLYSMLYAHEIPTDPDGNTLGSTWFVNAADAYDRLPEDMRVRIAPLKAVHTLVQYRATMERLGQGGKRAPLSEESRRRRSVHPVVRTHPETGRKSIYISDGHTAGIEGMDPAEGRALIDQLQAHCLSDGRIYRHRWAVGDLVIWDNCLTQHQAISNYGPSQRRLLHRLSTQGLTPQ